MMAPILSFTCTSFTSSRGGGGGGGPFFSSSVFVLQNHRRRQRMMERLYTKKRLMMMMMLRSKSSSESSKKGFSESSVSPKRFAKETEPNTTTKGSGFGAVRRIREVDFSGNARNEYVNPIEEEEEEEEEEDAFTNHVGQKKKKKKKRAFIKRTDFATTTTTTRENDDDALRRRRRRRTSRAQLIKRIFLPDGFPNTVSKDYLPWLKWQMLSLFFRDVLEVLSAQSLLVAVGMDVNQANAAAPVAGAAKWVLKDGTGGLATLALGALNTKKFDENPKFFWSAANSLEDVSRAMELLTPLFPSHFLLIAGTATFVRSAALTGRSSLINGTFMTHFSRNENAGDIRTKLEVQGRWLQIAALPVGIALFRAVTNGLELDFATNSLGEEVKGVTAGIATYGSMLFAHSFCCFMAAKSLNFETLSRKRVLIQAKAFVESNGESVLSVEEVSDIEGVWCSKEEKYLKTCKLGVTPDVVSGNDWNVFEKVRREVFGGEKFIANVVRDVTTTTTTTTTTTSDNNNINNNNNNDIVAACMLTNDAGVRDVLCAALVISKLKQRGLEESNINDAAFLQDALSYAKENARTFELHLNRIGGFRVDVIQTGDAPRFEIEII